MATWKDLPPIKQTCLLDLAEQCPLLMNNLDGVLQTMQPNISTNVQWGANLRDNIAAVFRALDDRSGAWQGFIDALSVLDPHSKAKDKFNDKVKVLGLLLSNTKKKNRDPFLSRIHFRVAREQELARVRAVMRHALSSSNLDTGIVLFQGDIALDWTVNFLERLEEDVSELATLELPEGSLVWANWANGKHIRMAIANAVTPPKLDSDGKHRAKWCLGEAQQRLQVDRGIKLPRQDATVSFPSLVRLLEQTHLVFIHTLDASVHLDGFASYLRQYLLLWPGVVQNDDEKIDQALLTPLLSLVNKNGETVRVLLILHIRIDPYGEIFDPKIMENREEIHRIIKQIAGDHESIYAATGRPFEHLDRLYKIRQEEFQEWLLEYEKWIQEAEEMERLTLAQRDDLIQKGRDAMKSLFSASIPVRMNRVEEVLRALARSLEVSLSEDIS